MSELVQMWSSLLTLALIAAGCAVAILAVIMLKRWQFREHGVRPFSLVPAAKALGFAGGGVSVVVSALGMLWMPESVASGLLLAMGIAGGTLGIMGGILLSRRRKMAGIMLLAGGLLGIVTLLGPLLLLIGGVLALLPVKARNGYVKVVDAKTDV
jgi:MFS family permease